MSLLALFRWFGVTSAQEDLTCPAGSYNIGSPEEVVCKSDPTCPYGDSMTPDVCDKFEAETLEMDRDVDHNVSSNENDTYIPPVGPVSGK